MHMQHKTKWTDRARDRIPRHGCKRPRAALEKRAPGSVVPLSHGLSPYAAMATVVLQKIALTRMQSGSGRGRNGFGG